jgi:NitT/TauT family transport system permease protein
MSQPAETASPPTGEIPAAAPAPQMVAAQHTLRLRVLFALPVSIALAFAIHWSISVKEPASETRGYSVFLGLVFLATLFGFAGQFFSLRVRQWFGHLSPLFAAAVLSLCLWEGITTGLRLLPLPYFPSPAAVLASLISDRKVLFDSTWHSLLLLLSGDTLGTAVALVTGVCIGWSARARYWGMPLLKIIGPIPATAWVPLAMVLSPSGLLSAIGLIALSVWFPVTMLTVSGIANTRAS